MDWLTETKIPVGQTAQVVFDWLKVNAAPLFDAVAEAQGVSRTVAAYSWLMAHPAGIIPIIGSQQAARIAEGVQALQVRWTRQDWYAVLIAARGVPLP